MSHNEIDLSKLDFNTPYLHDFNVGDKVKIKIDEYSWNDNGITGTFKQFLNESRNKIFTLSGCTAHEVSWELEEDPRWTIWEGYLEKINED